ncbi:3-hydroxybutyryl-CoA dehydrogenase (plasmid) [Haloterrigena turkmenica DSM 5511]|uniref:3-hydroxybutyryl-CoA dehydrogenase n=1 Tax=Haloterrigena turkmenica (strain ATCC 51198 / DSM 5511 / JCM 9101 / NCIMB 13204 / VKM B-1734 / 4k) TaxID=543526 RepID=D2RZV5_HALTV|nr:3-hydroxyacyl-CoA dehydrogenase family protein [Haloterrigena turkmenica]ADB62652.1 3-hydroxybutyryl-CoA dehydrogenase [Haloterrigena turkmenica DSM 5511]
MAEQAIGVIGAGTMGSGIAQLAVQYGFDVVIRDIESDLVEQGLDDVRTGLEEAEERDIIDDADAAFERVEGTTEIADVTDEATFIVEAAPEEMEIKKAVFEELDEHADPDVVLGTNTSSLSVTEIASVTDNPERVIGTHFFNPPVKMKLLEVVTGHHTSEETIDRIEAFADAVDRESILVDDYPGFATSRLGLVLGMEAARMVQEGVASAEDIDTAMEMGYNFPIGPLKLGDHNGWDVRVEVGEYLAEEFGREVYRPPQNVKKMVRAGDYGVKTGQGFYEWDDD